MLIVVEKEVYMKIIYGADYNPEQWSKEIWLEDMKYMKEAHVNMVNLNIFGWAILEPEEGSYDFKMLDELMDLLHKNNIDVDLATATAAQPAWLSMKYDDVLPKDQSLNTVWHGSRQSYCPNSHNYRKRALALVKEIGERYQSHPALKMWHINNEYSDHTHICYCDNCAQSFRVWLKTKYTLEELNERWGTSFWSQKYYHFSEIIPPRQTSADHNPGLVLDYKRFMSDSILELYLMENEVLKGLTPDIPITTNFMGNDNKPLDYYKWSSSIDIISWDSYPDISKTESPMNNALTHDLMRSLNQSGHILMEQAPNQVNWRKRNPNKRPGEMSTYSMQALARGCVGIMFFQWRQSLKGAEKFHSGMIPHSGVETRTFKEVCLLGEQLEKMSPIEYEAKVAIYMDYDCWWALEYEPGPSIDMKYMESIRSYYSYFFHRNIPVDFVFENCDLEQYDYVLAPNMYMIKESFAHSIHEYVNNGGHFILGPFSGIVDDSDSVFEEGYLSPFKDLMGISVIGYDVLTSTNSISYEELTCIKWCDEIKLLTAESIADYQSDYYKDTPAVTINNYGKGKSCYIGTCFNEDEMHKLLGSIVHINGIESPYNVEVAVQGENVMILNHTNLDQTFELNCLNNSTNITIKSHQTISLKSGEYYFR